MTFKVTGSSSVAGGGFAFELAAGGAPLLYRDTVVTTGYATAVYAYSSRRRQTLIFTSITGANELIQADPAVLGSTSTGLQVYR